MEKVQNRLLFLKGNHNQLKISLEFRCIFSDQLTQSQMSIKEDAIRNASAGNGKKRMGKTDNFLCLLFPFFRIKWLSLKSKFITFNTLSKKFGLFGSSKNEVFSYFAS